MRSIVGQVTPELSALVGDGPAAKGPALPVATFRELMQHVARLSYANKDHLLFFRGQGTDHKNKALASTFYPSIYRGERLLQAEIEVRFDVLTGAAKRLTEAFAREKIEGAADVRRRRLMQWSILQHYEVCATPLLDFTQSVRVACSFASSGATESNPFVFVFGMPYLTNRVSINSEHDLVNVRLLSICPPDALRPYFQEGYLAGTDEITTDYGSKTELDFNNRLIAKFQIERSANFWGAGFEPIPMAALYPENDRIEALCREIGQETGGGLEAAELGMFLQAWSAVESTLLSLARSRTERVYSTSDSIRVLQRSEVLPPDLQKRTDALRKIRNMAVHESQLLKPGQLSTAVRDLQALSTELKKISVPVPQLKAP